MEDEKLFRKFQIRGDGKGNYLVLYSLDLSNAITEVYQNKNYKNLSYEEVLKNILTMEEQYENDELIIHLSNNPEWIHIDTVY